MALDQLKAFLLHLQADREAVGAGGLNGWPNCFWNGLLLQRGQVLRFSGNKVGRVTVSKQETPGEFN